MTQRPSSSKRSPKLAKRVVRVLGWREWIGLPALGVERIKAKLDTGALTSALHVTDLERFQRDGKAMVRFAVHPVQRSTKPSIACEAEVLAERPIRSSNGHMSVRPVIRTTWEVFGEQRTLDLSLTSRDEMGFRMLLGRRALRNLFNVSPGRSYLSDTPGAPPRKRKTKKKTKKHGTRKAKTAKRRS